MNNCKLILATTYQDEDNKFCMKLVYTYTEERSNHETSNKCDSTNSY